MEEGFYKVARGGKADQAGKILKKNPTFNVNWRNEGEADWSPLHIACENDLDSIVSMLLAHPDIDVNQKDRFGNTPFMGAAGRGKISCVRLLLKDPRVKVNEPDYRGYTPLQHAAYNGHLDVIREWIASGREMDLGKPGDEKTDAIGKAQARGNVKVTTLLKRFKGDPGKTSPEVTMELEIVRMSQHFPPSQTKFRENRRQLSMASQPKLPSLQLRVVGSPKEITKTGGIFCLTQLRVQKREEKEKKKYIRKKQVYFRQKRKSDTRTPQNYIKEEKIFFLFFRQKRKSDTRILKTFLVSCLVVSSPALIMTGKPVSAQHR